MKVSLPKLRANKVLPCAAAVAVLSFAATTAKADVSVAWQLIGYPWAASKIAACNENEIFAMNTDHSLYVNYNGGRDGYWQYLTTPGSADSIACDGRVFVVMNYDKTIWRLVVNSNGTFQEWIRYSAAGDAVRIGGGPGVVTALNTDQSLWTSTANDNTAFPGQTWWGRGYARDAARFTGFQAWSWGGAGYNPWGLPDNVARFWALNYDGSLWYNDGVVLDDPGTWRGFSNFTGLTGRTALEIAAASPTELFVLDTTKHLWTGTTDPLPQSIDFTLSGGDDGKGGDVSGIITIFENGDWSISNANAVLGGTAGAIWGPYLSQGSCSGPGLNFSWNSGCNIGTNAFSNARLDLTGSGNTPSYADNWSNLVNSWLQSNVLSCLQTDYYCASPSGGVGPNPCWGSSDPSCNPYDTMN
jgi:hypothetical protein